MMNNGPLVGNKSDSCNLKVKLKPKKSKNNTIILKSDRNGNYISFKNFYRQLSCLTFIGICRLENSLRRFVRIL